jgi:hypothetical protein
MLIDEGMGKSPDFEHVYAITSFNPGSESACRQHRAESRRVKFDRFTPAWGAILSHQKTGVQEGVFARAEEFGGEFRF